MANGGEKMTKIRLLWRIGWAPLASSRWYPGPFRVGPTEVGPFSDQDGGFGPTEVGPTRTNPPQSFGTTRRGVPETRQEPKFQKENSFLVSFVPL
jgi:hypothetical protein